MSVQNRALVGGYEHFEEVDIECLNPPESGGCWSQLNSVQSSEQPVNPSIISSPLYEGSIKYSGQYSADCVASLITGVTVNICLIMIPAEKLLVHRDTGAVKQPLLLATVPAVESSRTVCEAHTGFTPWDLVCFNVM